MTNQAGQDILVIRGKAKTKAVPAADDTPSFLPEKVRLPEIPQQDQGLPQERKRAAVMKREEGKKIAPSFTGESDFGKWWSEGDSFRTLVAEFGQQLAFRVEDLKELAAFI